MTTTFAFQPDIGAKPQDRPFIRTTGMRLAQAQHVLELEIRKHAMYGSPCSGLHPDEIIFGCRRGLYRSDHTFLRLLCSDAHT
jgi:hypothetical protein